MHIKTGNGMSNKPNKLDIIGLKLLHQWPNCFIVLSWVKIDLSFAVTMGNDIWSILLQQQQATECINHLKCQTGCASACAVVEVVGRSGCKRCCCPWTMSELKGFTLFAYFLKLKVCQMSFCTKRKYTRNSYILIKIW